MKKTNGALLLLATSLLGSVGLYASEAAAGNFICSSKASSTYAERVDDSCGDGVTSVAGYGQGFTTNKLLTAYLDSAINVPSGSTPGVRVTGINSMGHLLPNECSISDSTADGTSNGTWAGCGDAVRFQVTLSVVTFSPPPM